MKERILLLSLLFASCLVSGQKLGFSNFSSLGGSRDASGTIYTNIGEPINTRFEGSNFTVSQGLLNSDRSIISGDAKVLVRFFYDENEDGYKNYNERFVDYGTFEDSDGNRYVNFRGKGTAFFAPPGSYQFRYIATDEEYFLTTQEIVNIEVENGQQNFSINFGLKANDDFSDATVYLFSDRFRCGRRVHNALTVKNTGLVPIQDTVFLELDTKIDSVKFRTVPDIIIDDYHVGWIFDLDLREEFHIHFNIYPPIVTTPDQLEEIYTFRTYINYRTGWTKEMILQPRLRCAYDPNDKLVYPDREDSLALIHEPLLYTIRFQNTGNDYADDVVLIDTLSDDLDVNTLTVIQTSHPEILEVVYPDENRNIVHFQFKGIYLPDSTTNEPGSNGHVSFSIEVKEGTPLDTEINNTGHIYFDFNPAIVTNTTSSTMVESYPIVSTEEPGKGIGDVILVYPNPVVDIVNLSAEVERLHIYDMGGQLLISQENTNQVNGETLDSGTYILQLFNKGKISNYKLVILNQ